MHSAALHLAPILAEKSRVPFFIAGGVLAGWAVFLAMALGLRNPDFPGNIGGQRVVIAISAVLVLAATSSAVITSSSPAKASAAAGATPPTPGGPPPPGGAPPPGAPAPSPTVSGQSALPPAAPSTAATTPAATTRAATTPAATTPAAAAPAAQTSLKLASVGATLAFDAKTLSAKAGTVTITFANSSPLEHNVAVAQGSTVLGSTPTFTGGSKTLTLSLRPGTYSFYCTVPGHRQAGMEGTLTVT
jgi:plastocyanin